MFGKFVQKWNAFRADWKVYQVLRRKENDARFKVYVLGGQLSSDDGASCIKKTKYVAYDTITCSLYTGTRNVCPTEHCKDIACPYFEQNCYYVNAVCEYKKALEQRREFWKNAKSRRK